MAPSDEYAYAEHAAGFRMDEDLSDWLARRSTSDADAAETLSWLGGAVRGDGAPSSDGSGSGSGEESAS